MASKSNSFLSGNIDRLGTYAGLAVFGIIAMISSVAFFDFQLNASIDNQARYSVLAQKAINIHIVSVRSSTTMNAENHRKNERTGISKSSARIKIASQLETMALLAETEALKQGVFDLQMLVSDRPLLRGVTSTAFTGYQKIQPLLNVIIKHIEASLKKETARLGKLQLAKRLVMIILACVALYGVVKLLTTVRIGLIGRLKSIVEAIGAIAAGDPSAKVPAVERNNLLADVSKLAVQFKDSAILRNEAEKKLELKSQYFAKSQHDLQPHINDIVKIGDNLLKAGLPENYRRDLQMICAKAHALKTISKKMSEGSKLQVEAGALQDNEIRVHLPIPPQRNVDDTNAGMAAGIPRKIHGMPATVLTKQPAAPQSEKPNTSYTTIPDDLAKFIQEIKNAVANEDDEKLLEMAHNLKHVEQELSPTCDGTKAKFEFEAAQNLAQLVDNHRSWIEETG